MKSIQRLSEDASVVKVVECPPPIVEPGFIKIKIDFAPINPVDRMQMTGTLIPAAMCPPPVTPGVEGSGVVVELGEGVSEDWKNKRVAVRANMMNPKNGTWQEYVTMKASVESVIEVPENVSMEQAAMVWGNPLTAVGLVESAKSTGFKTIVSTAAGSGLGHILDRHGRAEGFEVINIVRRQAQVESLQAQGAKWVVNTADPDWEKIFQETAGKMGPCAMFEAVGGEQGALFMKLLPPLSIVYTYGQLSGTNFGPVDSLDIILANKQLRGFGVYGWFDAKTKEEMKVALGKIISDLSTGGAIFSSKISKKSKLEDFAASAEFSVSHALEGKVLLVPGQKQ